MELYAASALAGVGYAAGYQQDALNAQTNQIRPLPADLPSMRSLYESDYHRKAKAQEEARVHANWNAAQNPLQSGIVPNPAYASMFESLEVSSVNGGVKSLTGDVMNPEQFSHNNMTPYFGSRVRQNVNIDANSSRLESYTGRGDLLQDKQEPSQLFTPTKGLTNVCGMQNANDFYMDRVINPRARNNDFPIAQVQVGPGLAQGYTADPSGGFQQENTLDLIRPKTVDELRVLTNPKTVYEGRVTGPAQGTAQRGIQAPIDKNRPDTYYEQSPDQWIKTTGAVTGETARPVQLVKATNRIDTNSEYSGPAYAKSVEPGKGSADDYGKASIMVYDQERDITGVKTVVANVTSAVKAAIAPLLDVLRRNKSEYFVDHARTFGSMNATFPEKPTLYDPDSKARTTIRETMENEDTERNMSSHVYKNVVWDPVNHMARTTIKETTIHDTGVGNIKAPEGGSATYATADDEAKTTTRETMALVDTNRNISSKTYKTVMYNPEAVAKVTHRQSMARNNRVEGNIGGETERRTGAYTHIPITVYPTQKQFISDYEYVGDAASTTDFRPRDRTAEGNAEIDGTREALNIASERVPTTERAKTNVSVDGIDMEVKKIMSDSMAARVAGNVDKVINTVPEKTACDFTKQPNSLGNAMEGRLDPDLLNALRSNPYNVLTV